MFFKKENERETSRETLFKTCRGKPSRQDVDKYALDAEGMIQNAVANDGGFMVFTFFEEKKGVQHHMIGSGFTQTNSLQKAFLCCLRKRQTFWLSLQNR